MVSKLKAKVGDVFAIPINDTMYAYGQIVGCGKPKCYVIYDIHGTQHPPISQIVKSPIVFLTHIVDIRIEDGVWMVLGNAPTPTHIIFPEYKVDTPNGYMITNYSGKILRHAKQEEVEKLNTRKSHSPVSLEKSVKDKFGDGEPYPYIKELLYMGQN